MAKGSINKVMLIGNLGQDPEVRYAASGTAVCNISIATTDGYKDKQTDEWKNRTEWHRVALFARRAEVAGEYLKKGSKVYVEGSLRTTKYQDKNGNDRWSTEVVANEMQMLDSKGGGDGGGGKSYGGGGEEEDVDQSRPPQSSGGGGAKGGKSAPPPDDFDDDIPF